MPSSGQTGNFESALTADELVRMTVPQVRERIERVVEDDRELMALLERDRRAGVRRLAVQLSRRFQRLRSERERQERLLELERRLWGRGIERVAGVDEAGRGCLAGPVVAAAVILPQDIDLPGLDDSKKLKAERREELLDAIVARAVAVGVGRVEAGEIDRINILQASLKAMRLALEDLGTDPQHVLVDGKHPPASAYAESAVVDGDARSLSMAAASVVAKVYRDRLMCEYDGEYPQYGFARHKGYGSEEHMLALGQHGPCPLHRCTFGPVAKLLGKQRSENFKIFAEGLASCRTRRELERMGHFIKEASGELSPDELAELRQFFREHQQKLAAIGPWGEALAVEFFERQGYVVLETGYRGAGGEIDLVAHRDGQLAFVEVKSSQRDDWGSPEERVDADKRAHLIRAARHYMERHSAEDMTYRFDVVAITFAAEKPEITHFENAFQV